MQRKKKHYTLVAILVLKLSYQPVLNSGRNRFFFLKCLSVRQQHLNGNLKTNHFGFSLALTIAGACYNMNNL
jgi:hypothetical protein